MQTEVVGGQLIAVRVLLDRPGFTVTQVTPASTVFRTVLTFSTARHVLELGQLTPVSGVVVPEFWLDHVIPPSLLMRMVPFQPTAKQRVGLAQLKASRSEPVPDG
ncbi:MAG TPA: hypothetical protein VGU71_00825 [Candidatus Dormibacteraeota bacterium]|nr:hypothetical protein [Candidatus Dormibacteraeota bacterium]